MIKLKLLTAVFSLIVTVNTFAFTGDETKGNAKEAAAAQSNRSKLPTTAQAQLLKAINEAKAKYNFESKNFIITKTNQSNGSAFALQVEDFLLSTGTKVQAYGTKSMQLTGYTIVKNETCLEIIIGIL